ncbi:hypothetical protein MMC16_000076 [Acarospora aff. strigata]|nr:hypothetical protein [Acarospora aff. strigata]
MQGFFGKPVDNLHAEPLIARWIRNHVPGWKEAVVVSKNPGGTKRVTSLADALKLNFGIVTTDRRRPNMSGSMVLDSAMIMESLGNDGACDIDHTATTELNSEAQIDPVGNDEYGRLRRKVSQRLRLQTNGSSQPTSNSHRQTNWYPGSSPLVQSTRVESTSPPSYRSRPPEDAGGTAAQESMNNAEESATDEYTDERAREVITGRLVQGHIVDDDYPSPALSAMSGSIATLPGERTGTSQIEDPDPMTSSFLSTVSSFQPDAALGGSIDATASSDEEEESYKNPELEQTITLVGNVRGKTVFIMDDMIDKAGSWIAAAETVVKRGGARKVYCIATHGLFGNSSLEEMEDCECIDYIVVTNSFPIPPEKAAASKKLVILDLSHLLAEAIRRNHYGESISQLFQHYDD